MFIWHIYCFHEIQSRYKGLNFGNFFVRNAFQYADVEADILFLNGPIRKSEQVDQYSSACCHFPIGPLRTSPLLCENVEGSSDVFTSSFHRVCTIYQ